MEFYQTYTTAGDRNRGSVRRWRKEAKPVADDVYIVRQRQQACRAKSEMAVPVTGIVNMRGEWVERKAEKWRKHGG